MITEASYAVAAANLKAALVLVETARFAVEQETDYPGGVAQMKVSLKMVELNAECEKMTAVITAKICEHPPISDVIAGQTTLDEAEGQGRR